VILNARPVQLLERDGVTLYTADTAFVTVLVNISLRKDCPEPDTPPVKPVPVGALQAYIVPGGVVPVGVYEKVAPVQVAVL